MRDPSGRKGERLVTLRLDAGHRVTVLEGAPMKNAAGEWIDWSCEQAGDLGAAAAGVDP